MTDEVFRTAAAVIGAFGGMAGIMSLAIILRDRYNEKDM